MIKVDFQGQTYLWTGHEWLTEQHIRPPHVITDQLNLQFDEIVAKAVSKKKAKKPGAFQPLSIQATIAPHIVQIIQKRFAETNDFVTRGEIVAGLIALPETQTFLKEAHQNTSGQFTFEEYVGNQVDFFSKGITENTSPYTNLFEKVHIENKWAYKPHSPAKS
jgi:hypothetical protein